VRAGSSCSLRNQREERHGRLLGGLALWMGERRVVVDCARAHMMLGTLFPCEQAQRYHPASLSSESGYPVIQTRKYGDAESVRGRRPGPPVWKIPHEALSLARARARLIWHRESRPRFVTNSVVAKAV